MVGLNDTYRLPERIISRVKGPAIEIKFVTEHKIHDFGWVVVGRLCVGRLWRVKVNESKVARHLRNLTCPVDPTNIEATFVRGFLLEEVS